MRDLFRSELLTARQARLAYPLVRLADPAVSLERWLAFARRVGRRKLARGGLVGVCDGRGYMHALYSYAVEQDPRYGARLRVRDLVIGRLPGSALTEAVLDSAAKRAAALGCASLLVDVPIAPSSAHAPGMETLGGPSFAPASVTYLRKAA